MLERKVHYIQARDVGWAVLDVALSPEGTHLVYSSWNDFLYQVSNIFFFYCSRSIALCRPSTLNNCLYTCTIPVLPA